MFAIAGEVSGTDCTARQREAIFKTVFLYRSIGYGNFCEKIRNPGHPSARNALIQIGINEKDENLLHYLSDEWVAWINGMWIASVLNLDVKHAMIGFLIDESQWPEVKNTAISKSLLFFKIFSEARAEVVEQIKSAASSDIRCQLISDLSATFFALLKTDAQNL